MASVLCIALKHCFKGAMRDPVAHRYPRGALVNLHLNREIRKGIGTSTLPTWFSARLSESNAAALGKAKLRFCELSAFRNLECQV